jgi:hypothetical protein
MMRSRVSGDGLRLVPPRRGLALRGDVYEELLEEGFTRAHGTVAREHLRVPRTICRAQK